MKSRCRSRSRLPSVTSRLSRAEYAHPQDRGATRGRAYEHPYARQEFDIEDRQRTVPPSPHYGPHDPMHLASDYWSPRDDPYWCQREYQDQYYSGHTYLESHIRERGYLTPRRDHTPPSHTVSRPRSRLPVQHTEIVHAEKLAIATTAQKGLRQQHGQLPTRTQNQ